MQTETSNFEGAVEASGGCSRRSFISSLASGLTLGFFLPSALGRSEAADAAVETKINAWIRIATDGRITLRFGGCEMGQGTMSGLPQVLAEELKVAWEQIVIEQADADSSVSYLTGGSSGISRRFAPLRTAGATARELLIAAAMLKRQDSTRGNYSASGATVVHVDPVTQFRTTWTYGELAATAATPEAKALLPATIPLTPVSEFSLVGKALPRADIPLKTNGKAQYGIDVFLPGMVFAVIRHCPTIGGTVATTPATPSGALAVVRCFASDNRGAVVKDSYNAVAVVADNTWKARKLAQALKVTWTLPVSTASVDSVEIQKTAAGLLDAGVPIVAEPSNPAPAAADIEAQVDQALAGAVKVAKADFSLPFLAHATMEVLNCTASVTFANGVPVACEVWAPTQSALGAQATAAAVTKLPASQIIVHTTFLGGGLGRKIEQDYISQAVQVAMAVKKPVKLTWFREEDFGHDNYRPSALIRAKAGIDANNRIVAWGYRNVSESILGQRGRAGLDSQAVEGSINLPYARGTFYTEWVPLPTGIPAGFWRSVGSSINAFAVESLVDMLAVAAGQDPFEFRYGIVTDARALAVLQEADRQSAWRKSLPAGRAWGMALAHSFGTMVCEVFEISQPALGSIQVHRVTCVVDCGIAVNPGSVEAQMQGGIVHGLSATLWGQSTFTKGVANETNFRKYRMLRLGEMPDIAVTIIPSSNPPSGVGEPGVPPVAAALTNAYFRLTGQRITKLPVFPGTSMSGL